MSLIFGGNPMGSSKNFGSTMGNSATFPHLPNLHENRESFKRHVPTQNDPSWITVGSYGVGHFLNDMTAACWFNYLLVFLTEVAGINQNAIFHFFFFWHILSLTDVGTTQAGLIMLSGQITDALWTPVVGLLSDLIPAPRFGKRKSWLLAGAILVNFSFFFVFSPCYFCKLFPVNNTTKTIMYCIFASVFNVGWATLQGTDNSSSTLYIFSESLHIWSNLATCQFKPIIQMEISFLCWERSFLFS